ncbi:MAG: hypothetical protein N3E50_02170 [Candidatus Goldbacteria bacterium]|nr:hypothetical protein [Candidatus Goldiibacteriota bacterium]
MWNNFYREMQDNDKNVPQEDIKKWQENMFKIISVINIPEHVRMTPAEKNLRKVMEIAKTKDKTRLHEIYNLLLEVENYFKDSLV